MAKAILPTNFTDDVLNESMDGKRRYNMIPNADGSQSLEDVTAYDQLGSNFGASNINATNQAINESFDKNKMISDMDELDAVTQSGYGVDALVVKEVNESLGECIKKYKLTKTITTITDSGIYYYDLDVSEVTQNALTDGTTVISTINHTNINGGACMYGKTLSNTQIRCFFNGSLSNTNITFNIIK